LSPVTSEEWIEAAYILLDRNDIKVAAICFRRAKEVA
jgi:hypothetical protein